MLGLNEYYDSLLLEAKSPEEIKKILEYQFVGGKGIPEAIFSSVFNADPTKKKAYTRWLFSKWDDEKEYITQLAKSNEIKRIFDYFKERNDNGLNLTSFKTVGDAVAMLPEVDKVLTKNGNGGPEDDYEIVYDTPEWKIAVPHTYQASEKLGKGCKWCTAGAFRNGESYFNDYTRSGPLWINYKMNCPEICPMDNKEYPYTRYQFCFETGDFRDCHDQMISSFSDIELPEEVKEFYTRQNSSYGEAIENDVLSDEERYEQYMYERGELSKLVKEFDGKYLSLFPVWNDEYIADETDAYYLYDEEDCVDQISSSEIDKDNWFVKDYEGYSPVIIKDAFDGKLFCYIGDNGYWDCVEDVDFIQDVGKFVVFAASNSNRNLYFFDLENNKLTKVDVFGNLAAIDLHITFGLPIKGEEGKTFEPQNIFVEATLENGRKSLIRLNTVDFKASVIARLENLTDEHFSVEFEKDEFGVMQPIISSEKYHYGLGYVGIGYHYLEFIDETYVKVCKQNEKYSYDSDAKLYNIYNNKTGKLLFEEPAKQLLPLVKKSQYYAYITDTCAFIYDLYKEKRITDIYKELRPKKYNGKFYLWLMNLGTDNLRSVDIFTTDVKKVASLRDILNIDEIFGIFITKDTSTNKKTMVDFTGTKLVTNAENFKKIDGSDFYFVIYGDEIKNNIIFNVKTGEVVENQISGTYYKAGTDIFTKSDGSSLLIPYIYKENRETVYKVDKIICNTNYALFVQIQNRYFFFCRGKFLPEQGIDINDIVEITDNDSTLFFIKTSNDIKLTLGVKPDFGIYNTTYPETPETNREYVRLVGTGIHEMKNKFYDIYNKIKYVWD